MSRGRVLPFRGLGGPAFEASFAVAARALVFWRTGQNRPTLARARSHPARSISESADSLPGYLGGRRVELSGGVDFGCFVVPEPRLPNKPTFARTNLYEDQYKRFANQ